MRSTLRVASIVLLGFVSILLLKPGRASGSSECSLGCVSTYGYDYNRDNINSSESILKATTLTSLTPTNSPDLSGIVYAQPLYVSQASITGQSSAVNVFFVATEENWVYALDADNLGNSPFWSANLNQTGETAVPDSVLPRQCGNIAPEVGITGTPVIDTANNILYVVSKHANGTNYYQRLNVLKLYDGTAAATAVDMSTALGSNFSALTQNQRAGLALVTQGDVPNGGPLVYVVWASHCDGGTYNGWVAAFHYTPGLLQSTSSIDIEGSSGLQGGIWMSGAAPAVTAMPNGQTAADVYLTSGNGSFSYGSSEFGQSVMRLHDSNASIAVTGSYTPNAWATMNSGSGANCTSPLNMPPPYTSGTQICIPNDLDLGAGGVILARPIGSGYLPPNDQFVVLAAGKEGVFYVLDPNNMSNSGADTVDPCSTYGRSNHSMLRCHPDGPALLHN